MRGLVLALRKQRDHGVPSGRTGEAGVGPRSSQENRRGPRILHLTSLDVPELGKRRARPATEGQGKQRLEKIAESGTSGM